MLPSPAKGPRRLFVSQSTANKYRAHIQHTLSSQHHPAQRKPSRRQRSRRSDIQRRPCTSQLVDRRSKPDCRLTTGEPPASRSAKYSHISGQNKLKARPGKLLTPFRYFLFNSSVEARKNLLFLAKAMLSPTSTRRGSSSALPANSKGTITARPLEKS